MGEEFGKGGGGPIHAKMGAEGASGTSYIVEFRLAPSGHSGREVDRAGMPPTHVALKISEGVV